jgi:hypothetical protein
MSKSKTTKSTDPATLQQMKVLERQRKRASRLLLKRRRQKSGQ